MEAARSGAYGGPASSASAADSASDAPPTAETIGELARSGSPEPVKAFATAHPGRAPQLENALLRAGRYDQIHALAQAGLTNPAAGTALVSPSAIKAFQATNGSAMIRLNVEKATLTKESAALAAKESHELKNPQAAAKLRQEIDGKLGDVNQEIGLRTEASQAISASKAGPGQLGQDPAVAAPLARLAADKGLPSSHPLNGASLDKAVSRVSDYDVAQWNRFGHTRGGPAMPLRTDGKYSLVTSPALANGVKSKTLTPSEARILGAMSPNEGSLDAVQGYDNQTISAGAMQKTTNAQGTGELPKQVYDFSQSDPAGYQRLFASQGWTAAHTGKGTSEGDYTLSFKDPADPKAAPLTGHALSAYIKAKGEPEHWAKTLGPMQQAGRGPAFQGQQVSDFHARLDTAAGTIPDGYSKPISRYVTSEQGVALAFDQHVNRPGEVSGSFGSALDSFYKPNRRPAATRRPGPRLSARPTSRRSCTPKRRRARRAR